MQILPEKYQSLRIAKNKKKTPYSKLIDNNFPLFVHNIFTEDRQIEVIAPNKGWTIDILNVKTFIFFNIINIFAENNNNFAYVYYL
jgi:hypothetical protein